MVLVLDVSSSHLDGGCVAGNNGQAAPEVAFMPQGKLCP